MIRAAGASLSADIAEHPTVNRKGLSGYPALIIETQTVRISRRLQFRLLFVIPQNHQKRLCPHVRLRRAHSDRKDHEFRSPLRAGLRARRRRDNARVS